MALTLLVATVVWLARWQKMERCARELDAHLVAKNRLEAANELAGDRGAIARAQREETELFLGAHRIRSRRLPFGVLLTAACLLMLVQPGLWLAWTRPWQRPPAAKPPPNLASIRWKSPKSETQATAVEEVPLAAHAESSRGLHGLTLEVAVNGESKLSVPVQVEKLETSGGPHEIETSLYMDQLDAQPYDIVSYYLRAQRVGGDTLPETTSPVQFVQVKPFRDDVKETPPSNLPGGKGEQLDLLKALKAAQLRLLKENFLLAHTDLAHTDAAWKDENIRVGREQGLLGNKTQEVIDNFIAGGVPAEIVNLLTQAKPQMADAAQKIQAAQNQPAFTPQGKALALITQIEKLMVKVLSQNQPRPGEQQPKVADPFEQQRKLQLRNRNQTPAGELETLAAEQRRLAEDLARPQENPGQTSQPQGQSAPEGKPAPGEQSPSNGNPSPGSQDSPDPSGSPDSPGQTTAGGNSQPKPIKGTPTERQTQISQRIGALLNQQGLTPETLQHLQNARTLAGDSLRQLDAGDSPAAREPAAAAASELRRAVDATNRAGTEQANRELAEALQKLSEASATARNAPKESSDVAARKQAEEAARQASETARQLAEAARKQQETGSAQAAQKLNDLARQLSGDDLKKALDQLHEKPRDEARASEAAARLQNLANLAGRDMQNGPLTDEQIEQLVQQMERMQANLQRLAAQQPGNKPAPQGSPAMGVGKEEGQDPGAQPTPGQSEGQNPNEGSPPERGRQSQGQGEGPSPEEGHGQAKGHGQGRQPGQAQGTAEQGHGGNGPGDPSQTQAQGSEGTGQSGVGEEGTGRRMGSPDDEDISRELASGTPPEAETGRIENGSSRTHSLAPHPLSPDARERLARELVSDLRETVAAASAVAPEAAARVQSALSESAMDTARHTFDPRTLVAEVHPALQGLIEQLRTQTQRHAREYQLTNQEATAAPPTYRDAVADYFERLSREAADAAHSQEGK